MRIGALRPPSEHAWCEEDFMTIRIPTFCFAALTTLANVLLNLDEVITKE